jgi:cytochrome oxidase assembly protein ShyY1
MVNRGWIPWDCKDFRYDQAVNKTVIEGVLYRGDAKTKYSKPNQVYKNYFLTAYPEELSLLC